MKSKFKDDITTLSHLCWYIWRASTYSDYTDKEVKIFLNGYFEGKRKCVKRENWNEQTQQYETAKYFEQDYSFYHFLQTYLFQKYKINNRYNDLIAQIDHYAFLRNESFKNGFVLLLKELDSLKNTKKYNFNNAYLPTDVKFFTNFETHKIEGEHLDNVVLENGMILKIGDYLEIDDKIGEDYKKLKHFDETLRNPSWELFYPSTDKDFKYVRFCFGDEQNNTIKYLLGNVWRIFSETISQIEYIVWEDNQIFVYTDIFKIEIQKAFDEQECKIPTNETLKNTKYFSKKIGNILYDYINNYELGLITPNELTRQIWDIFWYKGLIYDKSCKRTQKL